jgi:hypothetical protein
VTATGNSESMVVLRAETGGTTSQKQDKKNAPSETQPAKTIRLKLWPGRCLAAAVEMPTSTAPIATHTNAITTFIRAG